MYIQILKNYLLGYVRITIEGYFIERLMNLCSNKGILIWNSKRKKTTLLEANVSIKDFRQIVKFAKQAKCKVSIKQKRGLPFIFNRYRKIINEGVVWADQDLKCYGHFYNIYTKKGLPGTNDNALTLSQEYYNYAINYFYEGDIYNSMFYLGAVCHLIQDITVPQHATGDLLNNHMQFENYVKLRYLKIKRF